MIDRIIITRDGLRLTRCALLDAAGKVVDEFPLTGIEFACDAHSGGRAKLEVQGFRVSIVDGENDD